MATLFYVSHCSGRPTAGRHSSIGHDQGSRRSKCSIKSVRVVSVTDKLSALLHANTGRFGVCISLNDLSVSLLSVNYSADVIKVEHPQRGDDTRAWGPPFAKYQDASKKGPGESAYYLAVRLAHVFTTCPILIQC
jgi:hypothetical protein